MRSSFAALYRDHFRLVWAMVVRAGVAASAREDAVQEVWLTVHRRLPSYDGNTPIASWIAGIARHVVWRQIRAVIRARRKLVALDRIAPEALDDPLLARDRMRGLEGVIGSLEPIFRDVFVAVEILGATGPEAAQQLGLPLNTLYSRLRLARARVHAGLDALEQEPLTEIPPRELADRTWLALAPTLGLATKAASISTFAAALSAVAIGGVVAIAWPQTRMPATPSRDTTTAATRASTHAPATTPALASASPLASPAALEPAPIERDATPPLASTRAARPTPTREAPRDVVDDEAALLARAMTAMRAGDATSALDAIADHERRFPNGKLALDRKVTRVRALCLAGKTAQARGEATKLRRDHADLPAVAALGEGCDEPS
ncbi:MAG TPA: sigma factor [Nannocystaceae bacterium]|nr:sigma factor [Nannocystaceae bacterium]